MLALAVTDFHSALSGFLTLARASGRPAVMNISPRTRRLIQNAAYNRAADRAKSGFR